MGLAQIGFLKQGIVTGLVSNGEEHCQLETVSLAYLLLLNGPVVGNMSRVCGTVLIPGQRRGLVLCLGFHTLSRSLLSKCFGDKRIHAVLLDLT
jgi:hypothetical protein